MSGCFKTEFYSRNHYMTEQNTFFQPFVFQYLMLNEPNEPNEPNLYHTYVNRSVAFVLESLLESLLNINIFLDNEWAGYHYKLENIMFILAIISNTIRNWNWINVSKTTEKMIMLIFEKWIDSFIFLSPLFMIVRK